MSGTDDELGDLYPLFAPSVFTDDGGEWVPWRSDDGLALGWRWSSPFTLVVRFAAIELVDGEPRYHYREDEDD